MDKVLEYCFKNLNCKMNNCKRNFKAFVKITNCLKINFSLFKKSLITKRKLLKA